MIVLGGLGHIKWKLQKLTVQFIGKAVGTLFLL